jgi:DNA end-binding protein Ku
LRSTWRGSISLSLINVPVKLGSTSTDGNLGLHQVDKRDGSRIKYVKVNAVTGEEVAWANIAKGYDSSDGSMVVLDDTDMKKVHGDPSRVAEILMFTDAGNIPPLAVKSSAWVQPDTGGERTYALLASVMQETGKVAVLKYKMRDRESVAVLRASDGYLALETLEYDSDLIRPDFSAPADTSLDKDRALAHDLIKSMEGKYDHSTQADPAGEALQEVIRAKIEAGQVVRAQPEGTSTGTPADLTAVLKAAVDAKKQEYAPAPKTRGGGRRKAA